MIHLYLLPMLLLLVSCSSVSKIDKSNLSTAQSINGCDRFSIIYESLKTSCDPVLIKTVLEKRGVPFESILEQKTSTSDPIADLIRKAVKDSDTTCEISKDIKRPGRLLVNLAANRFCGDAVQLLSDKVSDQDFAFAVYKSSLFRDPTILSFSEGMYQSAIALDAEDKDGAKRISDTVSLIAARLGSDCKKGSKESCDAQEELSRSYERMIKAIDNQERDEAEASRLETPEGLIQKVCSIDQFIALNQKDIDKQKAVGKISGTVNMVILNNAGNSIFELKKMKEKIASQYQMRAQKPLKNYSCKNIESLGNPLMWEKL